MTQRAELLRGLARGTVIPEGKSRAHPSLCLHRRTSLPGTAWHAASTPYLSARSKLPVGGQMCARVGSKAKCSQELE